jgi:hypothetical protein
VLSRAYDTTWEADDNVGIYMLPHHTSGGSLNNAYPGASNVLYHYVDDQDGSAGLFPNGDGIYYPLDDSPVNFVAYYPYKDGVTTSYLVNVADQAEDIDLMIHNGVGTAYRLSQGIAVPLNFKHKLSKLVITAESDDPDIDMTGAILTITGMPTTATCDLYSGALIALGDSNTEIKFANPKEESNADMAVWEAIIIPHAAEDFPGRTFTIQVGDKHYTGTLTGEDNNITFEAGKEHACSLTLSPDDDE